MLEAIRRRHFKKIQSACKRVILDLSLIYSEKKFTVTNLTYTKMQIELRANSEYYQSHLNKIMKSVMILHCQGSFSSPVINMCLPMTEMVKEQVAVFPDGSTAV